MTTVDDLLSAPGRGWTGSARDGRPSSWRKAHCS